MSTDFKWLDKEKQDLEAIDNRVNELIQKYGTEEVSCAVCGCNAPISLGTREGLQIVRCSGCGHVYVSPRLPAIALNEIYSMEYWSQTVVNHGNPSLDERVQFDYQNAVHKLRRDILDIRTSGRLLDVGCSNGAVVCRANEAGFQAVGLEPSEDVARFAREAFGVEVVVGTIETADLEDNSFDIVMAHDVIEHVFDIDGFVKGCYGKLRQGGLLVLETPTTDSINFYEQGVDWMYCIPIEHINLFNQRNLVTILESAGFRIYDVICPYEENMVVRAIKEVGR